jgi:hypothetical protein
MAWPTLTPTKSVDATAEVMKDFYDIIMLIIWITSSFFVAAYVCNNQQPFVGSDGNAYGWVAANINGGAEQQTCCSCYKLTFTSGPVAGQFMYVQVSNTGSDLNVSRQ